MKRATHVAERLQAPAEVIDLLTEKALRIHAERAAKELGRFRSDQASFGALMTALIAPFDQFGAVECS